MNVEERGLYEVYENSGLAYFKKGDFTNALSDFQRAYQHYPNKGSAFNASLSAEKLQQPQQTLNWILACREHDKDNHFDTARALRIFVQGHGQITSEISNKLRKALFGNLHVLEILTLLRLQGDVHIVRQIIHSLEGNDFDILQAAQTEILKIYQYYFSEPQTFGGNVLYQSCPRFLLPGVRPTMSRLRAYRIAELVKSHHTVLDLGSNIGVLSLEIARCAKSVVGVEHSPTLNLVARQMAMLYRANNIQFIDNTIESFLKTNHQTYDLIIACAITQWIDLPLLEAFALISKSVKSGGHVLVESNNLATHDKNFYANCDDIAHQLGWKIQFKTEKYDDLFYSRAAVIFKKP